MTKLYSADGKAETQLQRFVDAREIDTGVPAARALIGQWRVMSIRAALALGSLAATLPSPAAAVTPPLPRLLSFQLQCAQDAGPRLCDKEATDCLCHPVTPRPPFFFSPRGRIPATQKRACPSLRSRSHRIPSLLRTRSLILPTPPTRSLTTAYCLNICRFRPYDVTCISF